MYFVVVIIIYYITIFYILSYIIKARIKILFNIILSVEKKCGKTYYSTW